MREPTQAPSDFDLHRSLTRRVVAAAFVVGVALFAYGVAGTGFALGAPGEGLRGVFEYLLSAVGLLLVVVVALVAGAFSRQPEPRPLRWRTTLLVGLLAPVLATGVVAGGAWVLAGGDLRLAPLGWVLLAQLALGLQLFVGAASTGDARPLLALEALAWAAFVVAVLVVAYDAFAARTLETTLALVGGSTALFVGFGGALYLFGYLLVRRPRYVRIR